jgi:hypothetical protein
MLQRVLVVVLLAGAPAGLRAADPHAIVIRLPGSGQQQAIVAAGELSHRVTFEFTVTAAGGTGR